jgi:hypothetical protein
MTSLKCSCGHERDDHVEKMEADELPCHALPIHMNCMCKQFTPVIPLAALIPSLRNGASLTAEEVKTELRRQLMLEIRKLWEESKKEGEPEADWQGGNMAEAAHIFERKLSELEVEK